MRLYGLKAWFIVELYMTRVCCWMKNYFVIRVALLKVSSAITVNGTKWNEFMALLSYINEGVAILLVGGNHNNDQKYVW